MSSRIVVGIPTVGRAAVLCEILRELQLQTRVPDGIIVCGTRQADVAGADLAYPGVQLLVAPPGLPRQRNAIIAAAGDADILLFFDDDFVADPDYVAIIEAGMTQDRSIVVATGMVVADGIGGPGLSAEQARARLAATAPGDPRGSHSGRTVFSGYGCNMALRLAPMRANDLRFDERLPLYGWQEDVDLSRRLAGFGRVVLLQAARGVHLGVKVGRNSGLRLGYSQVANPIYLSAKRQGYPWPRALQHIARNVGMNLARWMRPEPHVDRRGRLRGNLLAFRDLLVGRMAPERILDL